MSELQPSFRPAIDGARLIVKEHPQISSLTA
jgi:hypothetical protein